MTTTATIVKTHRQTALDKGMLYTVSDVPSAPLGLALGFQHFMTMLGATALIPILLIPAMGGTPADTADVMATIFFVSGLNTLIQTTFGDRLPIIQGGSFAFLTPTFNIIFNSELQAIQDSDERFRTTMRVIQGAVLICGIVQVTLGYTGLLVPFIRLFSPISIAPTVAMVGLGLAGAMNGNMLNCEWLWLLTICLVVLYSQLLNRIKIPCGFGIKLPIFSLFPVLFAIFTAWFIAGMVEVADTEGLNAQCKTKTGVFDTARGAKFPYPGQWGAPLFRGWAIGPMLGAMCVSMVESIGDYYACAKLAGAPPPSGAAVVRGLASEGWGLILCGLFGTSNGTTSYGENIGAIAVTRVGSRAVAQAGAVVMMVMGLFPKFCAIFVAMPDPIIGGMYSVLFGLISSAGLSLLQFADMSSQRNLFIVGFCLYNSLAIAAGAGNPGVRGGSYFAAKFAPIPPTAPSFPFGDDDEFWGTFLNNTMIISLLSGVILDNIIPGTKEERGKAAFESSNTVDTQTDEAFQSVYGLPWCFARLFKNCVYLDWISLGFQWPTKPKGGYISSSGDCCEMFCPCIFKSKPPPPPEVVKVEMVEAKAFDLP